MTDGHAFVFMSGNMRGIVTQATPSVGLWSRTVGVDGQPDPQALRELAETFSYCVYAWWRRAGLDPVSTATASIACFERWLGEFPPRPGDENVARMRDWMIARLPELAEQGVKLNGEPPIAIDRSWAEKRYAEEPEGAPTSIFQRRWALTVIESSMTALRDEYAARGEQNLYSELLGFAGFGQPDGNGYSSVSQRLGQTGGAIRKAVFEFRKRQREILLRYINDTVLSPADADSELTALLCACDETSSAPLPSAIQGLRPDEILVRAMRSVVMTQDGSGAWQPPTLEEADLLFPQYEIVSLVGRGGMGAVYRGRQIELDRAVAIKLLPLEVSVDPVFADRFRREARAMAKLHHPNIIAIHDFGATQEGHLFFVMEYVDGADLHQMIHGPGIAPALALEIIVGVCDALAYAHGKGVVHRDIKPANVMVSRHGEVKVADFGLARLMDPGAEQIGHTVTGTVMGTPGYMAPEQMCGMNVDHRADIYSLGVMLYEMLCGEVPRGIFDPPSVRVPEVNSSIDQVVIKAMQQQPDRRYQTTTEMKTDVTVAAKPKPMVSKIPEPALAPSPLVPPQPAPQPAHKSAPEATPKGRRKAGAKSRNLAYFGIAAAMLAILGILIFAGPVRKNSGDSVASIASNSGPADTGKTLLFNGHRYQFMPGTFSWNEAKAKAEAMGGHLATVTSKEENEWIYTTFQTKLDSTVRASSMWLGGSAEAKGQPWKWVTGEPFAYTDWTEGEPNYASMSGQPVAGPFGLVIKRHGKLCWFDDPMKRENSSAGFIVEWEHEGTSDSAPSAPLVVDLLALADVKKDAEGGLWSRQGTDLLVAGDPASERNGGIRFGFALPVRVTGSYKLDVEFTRHGPRGTISLVLPLPNNRSVAAHFQEASPYAGLASVRGYNTRDKENPTRTPNQLEDGRRYRASVQVVMNGDQADITATLEGKPLFRFQGPAADLDGRAKLGFTDTARPGMKSIDPVTWHSVRITLLDGGKLTPARDDVALPAGVGNLK